jgi:hypothetical protein
MDGSRGPRIKEELRIRKKHTQMLESATGIALGAQRHDWVLVFAYHLPL